MILGLGLVAFMFDTFGGVLFAKLTEPVPEEEDQPDDRRGGHFRVPDVFPGDCEDGPKEEDPQNFLLMHAAGANVAGQVASVIAGGIILALVGPLV